jgi:hemoglobin
MTPSEQSLYTRVGGYDTLLALARKWHELCLEDPIAAHPFEHQLHPQHDERFAAYLSEALGGPTLYTGGYGDETHVQRLHACNGPHLELDEACIARFQQALQEVAVPPGPAAEVLSYFKRAIEAQRVWAEPHIQVPDGLPFNHA